MSLRAGCCRGTLRVPTFSWLHPARLRSRERLPSRRTPRNHTGSTRRDDAGTDAGARWEAGFSGTGFRRDTRCTLSTIFVASKNREGEGPDRRWTRGGTRSIATRFRTAHRTGGGRATRPKHRPGSCSRCLIRRSGRKTTFGEKRNPFWKAAPSRTLLRPFTPRADGSHRYGGTAAVGSLLRKKYKVQALSSSHYHAEETNAKRSFERYGPNALFRSVEELKGFLRWGADAAHRYGDGAGDGFFTSYVFATQGLDLAIPTPQLYLRDGSGNIDVFDKDDMSRLPPLRACPKKANDDELNFVFEEVSGHPGRLLSVVSTP